MPPMATMSSRSRWKPDPFCSMRSFLEMISLGGDRHSLMPAALGPAWQTTVSSRSSQPGASICLWNLVVLPIPSGREFCHEVRPL